MLDHKPPIVRQRTARVRPSGRWMWLLVGVVAVATAGLIVASVALIGGEEAAVAPAYQYRPLHENSGFIEGLDGPIVAAPYTYQPLHENSGFFAGLDPGPIPATATPTREYVRIGGGFFEGLDPGPISAIAAPAPIPETYQAVQLHADAGFMEGLDGPVTAPAPIPETYQYVQLWGGPIE